MLKSSARSAIRLRGVRHNNLKNFDLDLPLNQLIVITGLSGSGKSSLAFDTLFAEGQRRYIETFSPYARQFFDRMDKPQVDSIEGIPPAIAIEQRNTVKTTRSTVGTITEICDYMKLLWPQIAQLHCRHCRQPVHKQSPRWIWESLQPAEPRPAGPADQRPEVLITFDLPLTPKLPLDECLALVAKQGYQRLLLEGQILRLEELASRPPNQAPRLTSLTVVQDRLRLTAPNRARFVEACEQAYHFGKGKLTIYEPGPANAPPAHPRPFSNRLHCATCDLEYREPTPALFSFNHPVGACPTCRGFGRVISIDYSLALPDRSKTLAQGVVKPWQTGLGAECQSDLLRICRQFGIPTDVPFERLARQWQDLVIQGEPGYGQDAAHQWPRAWYGIKGYFRWLESRAYKMHVRVLLSRYRAYTPCPDCQGKRFRPEALLYRVRCQQSGPLATSLPVVPPVRQEAAHRAGGDSPEAQNSGSLSLADFYQLPIRDALGFVERLAERRRWRPADPLGLVLGEVRSRLGYLQQVGLGYLTLDRPTRSLSGGETERVNLTTCLGTRLVNTLFVLDEPSVGLHPRDTERLVRILEQLRDAGNTVVVVEHEASVMRAANQIVDLGPGHGATGGQVVFQGAFAEILKSPASLTGQYLSGRRRIEIPARRPVDPAQPRRSTSADDPRAAYEPLVLKEATPPFGVGPAPGPLLLLSHATRHNLHDLAVAIPLNRFVCVTGVSGSGKTTLVREVLLPALAARLKTAPLELKASDRFAGGQNGEDNDHDSAPAAPPATRLEGAEPLGGVTLVDQSILGKTPRSNPAVYIGAFDDIRQFFAQSDAARQRGLNASAFSFNSTQGQCQRCRGAGFEKIEMQFLSDVFIRCPDCNGRRYRPHILEVKITLKSEPSSGRIPTLPPIPLYPRAARHSFAPEGQQDSSPGQGPSRSGRDGPPPWVKWEKGSPPSHALGAHGRGEGGRASARARGQCQDAPPSSQPSVGAAIASQASRIPHYPLRSVSIADLLDATVEEALAFLSAFPESRPARHAVQGLLMLAEVGLGYLKLGQPINTLSGGECQRLKLVRHLAEVQAGPGPAAAQSSDAGQATGGSGGRRSLAGGPSILANGPNAPAPDQPGQPSQPGQPGQRSQPSRPKPTLFLFDEPTTGLHFHDVRLLLRVFARLVDAGHSVVVIEHNLDVIKSADWLIDLGPEAGDQGGRLVAQGTPEQIAACPQSHTGQALREVLRAPPARSGPRVG